MDQDQIDRAVPEDRIGDQPCGKSLNLNVLGLGGDGAEVGMGLPLHLPEGGRHGLAVQVEYQKTSIGGRGFLDSKDRISLLLLVFFLSPPLGDSSATNDIIALFCANFASSSSNKVFEFFWIVDQVYKLCFYEIFYSMKS
ncbi:MAG: hypothetical protein JXB10_06165 [Pirellulales bacterium]|nr:hypothetical protein [Pirellulales bacterium]